MKISLLMGALSLVLLTAGCNNSRRRRSQGQPDRKDKLDRLEIRARPVTGAARDTPETRANKARPVILATQVTGGGWGLPETRARRARLVTRAKRDRPGTGAGPETQVKRDGPATRVYKVRPRRVRRESIAIRTTILEERVASGIKTGLSCSS